jgi:UDP-glucose 4-epimerase|tara:strand:+ start:337 stop:1284 length:948 start_codon:yes stop_codon:yes gene_type:complete
MILITGAAGYIGSHIIFKLIKENKKFVALDNFSTNNKKNNIYKFILNIDVGNSKKIGQLLSIKKIKTVIHAAAYAFPQESEKIKYLNNNVIKTKKFINICIKHKVKNFVFFSSSNVYKEKNLESYNENDLRMPVNYYGKTKKLIENFLLKKKNQFNKILILRIFNIAGYDKNFNYRNNNYPLQRIFPIFKKALKRNKKITLFYYYEKNKIFYPRRDFLHIIDFTNLLFKMLRKMNNLKRINIFNVGSGKSHSTLEIFNLFQKYSNHKIIFSKKILKRIELKGTKANINKLKKILKWKPKYNCKDIVYSTLKWKGL